ncbi:hypothetical protein OHB01_15790 [Microbispora hainanensis]|uniref:hypothetical protein n=1 Tax=Microbispora hainanensis TaxID=568844 RepID=UPI002E2A233C|nr:hypothetical protein [Microbispora hainanensis]
MAALALGLAGTAFVVGPSMTAQAETAQIDMDYRCTRGVAGSTPVNLKVTLALQTALKVREPLDVRWGLAYKDSLNTFLSPGLFPAGARVTATGVVGVLGEMWEGELNSIGSKDEGELDSGGALGLPELVSGSVGTTEPGVWEIEPRNLYIDFTPPASEEVVNDDEAGITYDANWQDSSDRLPYYGDYLRDVHWTKVKDARVDYKFTGTGIDFISEQSTHGGPVRFFVDGKAGIPATADSSKERNGAPVLVEHKGNHNLWSMRGLSYGQHTLTVYNGDDTEAYVDAFRVITEELRDPPQQFRAVCKPVKTPTAIRVVIGGGTGSSPSASVEPSESPDTSASPSVSPTDENPGEESQSPSPSPSATPSPSPSASPSPAAVQTQHYIVTAVVTQGSPSPTATRTVTLTATPSVAQVAITPQGGAQTGEAPERVSFSGMLLIGSGGALLLIGMLSGVAMLRRRAAHSGERG